MKTYHRGMLVAFIICVMGRPGGCATISITDQAVYSVLGNPCPAAFPNCGSRAFIEDEVIGAGDIRFNNAFNAWNLTQPADQKWTLKPAAPDLNVVYRVYDFTAVADVDFGGLNIGITLNNFSDNSVFRGDLYWVQGLFVNYAPGVNANSALAPYNALDTFTLNQINIPGQCNNFSNPYCDPMYPFQNDERSFIDQPRGPYAYSSFRGSALVAEVDRTNRVLTVYSGVSYGFDLFQTPEPGTWMLCVIGLSIVFPLPRLVQLIRCRALARNAIREGHFSAVNGKTVTRSCTKRR